MPNPSSQDPSNRRAKRAAVRAFSSRRRRDGDPPAGQPAPVDPRNDGGLSGGAAEAMTFED